MSVITTDVDEPQDPATTLTDLVSGFRVAMLATTSGGTVSSRPLTVQHVEGDLIWFVVEADAPWLHDATQGMLATVFVDERRWVSISGTARTQADPAIVEAEAGPVAQAWFGGDAGGQAVALVVEAMSVDIWTAPNKAAQALSVAKGLLTGQRPDLGDREHFEL